MRDIVLVLFGILSLIGFILMWIDKRKAIRQQWRIPERTFYLLGLIGGATGIWISMFLFRHKIRKSGFVGILLVDLLVNLYILYLLR
jgi:uncharacterized membrane protein YsdA (DUF1294 family)